MFVAVVVPVGGGAAVEDVERDVAWRRAENQQAALAQRRLVTTVTEGTPLQPTGRQVKGHRLSCVTHSTAETVSGPALEPCSPTNWTQNRYQETVETAEPAPVQIWDLVQRRTRPGGKPGTTTVTFKPIVKCKL